MEQFTGSAPEHICALFRDGCSGTVEMVNSRGIYLRLGENLVLLCHSHFGTVPNGASLDQWDRLPLLLAMGQPVRVEDSVLYCPSGSLELRLRSVPRDLRIFSPPAGTPCAGLSVLLAQAKETGLSSLVYPLFTDSTPRMNPYCTVALPWVKALLQALAEENEEGIRASAQMLLGLGPGLTPSGDDFLCGLLYGLRHSPARDTASCAALTKAVLELAGERTNAVSADCLASIARDAPFDRIAAAWTDPEAGALDLTRIGSNSGCEMLLGLLCAEHAISTLTGAS